MKQYVFTLILLAGGFGLFAQNLDDINEMMGKKDFASAKAAIDKYLTNSKNITKPDGWYYKGRIYNAYSWGESISPSEAVQLKWDAYESFKNYLKLEPKESMMKLENYMSFLDLYVGFDNAGINLFNGKDYEGAMNSFKKALEVKDFILEKKYTYNEKKLYPLDTTLLVNTALAANQAKKEEEAVRYFRILSDANVSGSDYQQVYEYLADYYSRTENESEMNAILAKAQIHYPCNDFFIQTSLAFTENKKDESALMAKYDEIIRTCPGNFTILYFYSGMLYNLIYTGEKKHPDDAALSEKLTKTLSEAIKVDTGRDATFLMANHLFTRGSEYSSEASMIRGNKPEDVKKKKELNALANKYLDEFIPYGDSYLNYMDGLASLKPIQKANYRSIAANLSEVYAVRNDAKKAAEYDKRKAAKQ